MSLYCIFWITPQGLYGQVSFDPFEEGFNGPSVAVDIGDHKRPKVEVVGDERYDLVTFNVVVLDQAKVFGIQFTGFVACKTDGLIPNYSYEVVDVIVLSMVSYLMADLGLVTK